jgi:hypothetical protein
VLVGSGPEEGQAGVGQRGRIAGYRPGLGPVERETIKMGGLRVYEASQDETSAHVLGLSHHWPYVCRVSMQGSGHARWGAVRGGRLANAGVEGAALQMFCLFEDMKEQGSSELWWGFSHTVCALASETRQGCASWSLIILVQSLPCQNSSHPHFSHRWLARFTHVTISPESSSNKCLHAPPHLDHLAYREGVCVTTVSGKPPVR